MIDCEKFFLCFGSLVTDGVDYSSDSDGNIAIYQGENTVLLTPDQQISVFSLLSANIDVLNYSKCCKEDN